MHGPAVCSAAAKRAFDAVGAGLALVVLAPVMVVISCGVLLRLGRPVLFRQVRPGRYGEPFTLLKFRTMKPPGGAGPASDADRLTPFGRWLRATSLDELPELWNILRGDMSLVGPRPLLMEYLPLYDPDQARRHEVRPGLTGLAQVSGRNDLSWKEVFELDVHYVDNRSLWLDARILLTTVRKVVARDGITQQGHATREPFRGNDG